MATLTIISGNEGAVGETREYTLTDDAACIVMEDGSARLLDMGDRFYAVPPVGALMLQQTLQHGPETAAAAVAAEYGIDLEQADADLRRFLANLEQQGVLRRRGQRPSRKMRIWPALVVNAVMLKAIFWLLPTLRLRTGALLTLAKLSFSLFGWTATVSAWKGRWSTRFPAMTPEKADAAATAIDEAVCSAASKNLLGVACKERAISCFALAKAAGLPAALVIGVELFPLAGHCWCEAASRIVSDDPRNCSRFTPALRYG